MIHEQLRQLYIDSGKIESLLEDTEISALLDFLNNWENIKIFNETYYHHSYPKTVLCGINPGRHGAGKTGIPFIDFSSLSTLIDGVNRADTERSAQFFFDVVSEFGASKFYNSFYVTNVSWVGYISNNMNINYYRLPEPVKDFVLKAFKYEIGIVSPKVIISMGREVKITVNQLFNDTPIDVDNYLPHPYPCSFPARYQGHKREYIELLSKYIRE